MRAVSQGIKYEHIESFKLFILMLRDFTAIGHIRKFSYPVAENQIRSVVIFQRYNFQSRNRKWLFSDFMQCNIRYSAAAVCIGVKYIAECLLNPVECFPVAVYIYEFFVKLVYLADIVKPHNMVNVVMRVKYRVDINNFIYQHLLPEIGRSID